MTERLYYADPACRAFTAVVARSLVHDGRPAVVLDRTAFYPTSGGQPHDTGQLRDETGSAVQVVEALDDGDDIVHVLASPLPGGARVQGTIAWARRFDHMQQHTGQHVLSAAFERTVHAATASFHMGADLSTIDLVREVTAGEIARAEDEANRVVWDDRPVTIRFATAEEAATLPLRKEPGREGTLRLIDVHDFDLSACGGTHVSRTGEIGMIAVVGSERLRGGSRLTFVCGGRALRSFRVFRHAVTGAARVLSASAAELPDAVERLQAEAREQRKALADARKRLAGCEAATLLEGATALKGVRVLVRVMEGWDAASLKTMASAAVTPGGAVVGLLTSTEPFQVVLARSSDVTLDAGECLRHLVGRFGGRGGGKGDLAQGGGLTGDSRQIVWMLSGLIEDAVSRTPPG